MCLQVLRPTGTHTRVSLPCKPHNLNRVRRVQIFPTLAPGIPDIPDSILPGSWWSSGCSCKYIAAFVGRGRRIRPSSLEQKLQLLSPRDQDLGSMWTALPFPALPHPLQPWHSPGPWVCVPKPSTREVPAVINRAMGKQPPLSSSISPETASHVQITLNFFPGLGIRKVKGRC